MPCTLFPRTATGVAAAVRGFKAAPAAAYNRRMSPYRIPGGLVLAAPTHASAASAIRPCPLPPRLYLALVDGAGRPLQRCVDVGQTVRRGDVLARAGDAAATALPAPTSGRIAAIEERTLAHSGDRTGPTLVLEADGRDDEARLPPLTDWPSCDTALLRRRLADAGVVGLGGAGFATALKLASPLHTLILNGAECEPYIGCDEALLRERADVVVAGAALLGHIAAATQVVIALEDRMVEAAAAVSAALAGFPALRLERVPTIYPQGGERQLIQVLCGREVPSGRWPVDIGIAVHNVATAAAAWRAVAHGEALTSRIVSLGGRGVAAPGHFEVRIGTPISALVAAGGGYTAEAARLVLGGPLMGVALPHDAIGLERTSNSILVLADADLRRSAPERPCIRCGDCAQVCPMQLQPQELLRTLRNGDAAAAGRLGLADCIECGCCAFVCPSQIPLVDWYREAKSAQAAAAADRRRADHARERYLARHRRIEREQADKVARVAARRDALAQQQAPAPAAAPAAGTAAQEAVPARMDKSAVLAAIARGKARRAQSAAAPPPQDDEA